MVGGFLTIALKNIGNADTSCVAKIMNSVRGDSDTISKNSANELKS